MLETIVRTGLKPVKIAFLCSLGLEDPSLLHALPGRLCVPVVDFTARMTLPLIVTQESGTHSARFFWLLVMNILLQCKNLSSLTVTATDANRLKRLLETIGRNDPVPGSF